MTDASCSKSHKEWRRLVKRLRRKRIRQRLAQMRKEEEKRKESSPTFLTELAKKRLLDEYEMEEYEKERKERHEKWLRDEEEAQKHWQQQQKLKELAREEKQKELERIRREWEEEQQKIRKKKEEIERLRIEEEKRKEEVLERINKFIENGGEVPAELMSIRETNPGKEICSFFNKVGACRFGPQCSRNHQYPGISRVLLFTNFYSHFTLDQNHSSEYDTDIGLEFEDSDMYLHFKEFYKDVVPELKKFGTVKMVKVCCNTEFHLRGNVYVEYSTLRDALVAYQKFHGRWYGSKQLNVEFVSISDWGRAVCGDFARNRCPKGKSCNFLHVFKNPKNEYPIEWNRSKNSTSVSYKESSWSSGCSPENRSFRWSESPERVMQEKTKENIYRSKSPSQRSRAHKKDRRSKRRSSSSEKTPSRRKQGSK